MWNAEQEEDLDEEDAAAEAAAEEQRQAEMDEAAEEDEKTLLHPQDIDAYWLQRRIAGTFTDIDASRSQTLAEDVLTALAVSTLLGWPAFWSLYTPEGLCCAEGQVMMLPWSTFRVLFSRCSTPVVGRRIANAICQSPLY